MNSRESPKIKFGNNPVNRVENSVFSETLKSKVDGNEGSLRLGKETVRNSKPSKQSDKKKSRPSP